MTAVRATAHLERISYQGNTEVDHLLLKAKSTRVYSLLYRVDNEYETFIDSQSGYPIRYLRRINEGSIRGNFATNFHQDERRAIYDSVEEVEANYRWPSPDWYDYSAIPDQIRGKEERVIRGGGSEPFATYKWLRGVERGYLDLMAALNVEVAGEFLVMAAALMEIKSRTLLPAPDEGETL